MRKSLLLGSIFFLVGFGLGGFVVSQVARVKSDTETKQYVDRLREGGGTYTNPLLICDVKGEPVDERYLELETNLNTMVSDARTQGIKKASIYFRDLTDGSYVSINPDERYVPASLNKVPLMMKVLEKAQDDPEFLNYPMVNPDPHDANESQVVKPVQSMVAFAQYRMEDVLRLMIVNSDNNAYNAITKVIGYDDYLDLFKTLRINTNDDEGITVEDYSYFLRVLYNSTVLNRDMSEKALILMTETNYTNALKAGVPDHVKVAHKFGTYGDVDPKNNFGDRSLHDCGIVYVPGHPYLLCVMSKGNANLVDIERFIAGVSKRAYDYVSALN